MDATQETTRSTINYLMGHSAQNNHDYGETYEYVINRKKVVLHSKGMFSQDFKEDGRFPACIAPDEYPNYVPHYWYDRIDLHGKEHPNWDEVAYFCDILITDVEYDAFVVRINHIYGESCETYMHNCVQTMFDGRIMLNMAHAVRNAERILCKLEKLHNKKLKVTDEDY